MSGHMLEMIELFGGLGLTLAQARATICAYAGTTLIREWSSADLALPSTSVPVRHFASVRLPANANTADNANRVSQAEAGLSVIGSGTSAAAALEDLLWQLVLPRLLTDGKTPAPALARDVVSYC